jgi:hypothetical protein
MDLLINHIENYLFEYIESSKKVFELAFTKVSNKKKEEYKQLLRYVDNLIYASLKKEQEGIQKIHLHFQYSDEEFIKILFEYFVIREHLSNLEGDSLKEDLNPLLKSTLQTQLINKKRLQLCPAGASAKNGGNKIFKKWKKEKKLNKNLINYLESLSEKSSFCPKTIFNSQIKDLNFASKIFENIPFLPEIDESELSYNFSNVINTLDDIDHLNSVLIDSLKTIFIFNCERKTNMSNFNLQEIETWNNDFETNVERYIIITFGTNNSSHSISNKHQQIKERFMLSHYNSYSILFDELKLLCDKQISKKISLDFQGQSVTAFLEDFFIQTKINGLYELRSIKMMNIYSICYTDVIRDFILKDVFSIDLNPTLITDETKEDILTLPKTDIQSLKKILTNILDLIIQFNIKKTINEKITRDSKIVLDDLILKNELFFNLIRQNLNIKDKRRYLNWDNIEDSINSHILILSYRDQGNYDHHFYPNINELKVSEDSNIDVVLPAFLFKQTYDWSHYNLLKAYQKTLDHPIRRSCFDWDALKNKINQLKPEKSIDISWDLESNYSNDDTRITFRISYMDTARNTCNPSDLLIYREHNISQSRIKTIRWIYENIEFSENSLCFQKLDDLIDEFNPAEKLIDTEQQNQDLKIIKQQFELGDENVGRLWKILLGRKAEKYGVKNLYNEIQNLFSHNNMSIVSYSHFESTWINPNSKSLVPRGNKVFKIICDYLDLSITYRRIIYTIKNRTITGRRNATRIYSKLLKDLFNDGCFDDGADNNQILSMKVENYKINHNLDELGIDEEKPLAGLLTLIELIRPELSYKEVHNIEKNEQ